MDIPFHNMTDAEKEEITPYIQQFIDNCAKGGVKVTPVCAYNLNEEMFAINYEREGDEWAQWKWIYRGEEGERKFEERQRREWEAERLEAEEEDERRNMW